MSKRNNYKLYITDTTNLEAIITDLEQTGLVVEVSEPTQGQSTRVITAEDAPAVGEAFIDHTKNPNGYIYWKTVKQSLQPYTDTIDTIQHTLEDDTGCYRKITTYTTKNNTFTQTNQTKRQL